MLDLYIVTAMMTAAYHLALFVILMMAIIVMRYVYTVW